MIIILNKTFHALLFFFSTLKVYLKCSMKNDRVICYIGYVVYETDCDNYLHCNSLQLNLVIKSLIIININQYLEI